ncbi:MAG: hypothetical protein E7324_09435 [Clostridiales bacterium]|nr:hypothetical protein [Clostridiales bacterium]
MKKMLIWLLCLMLLMGCMPAYATGEAVQPLAFSFGLFSLDVPADSQAELQPANALYMAAYNVSPSGLRIAANWAPLEEYEYTAMPMLDSYVSLQYALVAGEEYTETEIQMEKLENGLQLRWQLMRGEKNRVLWCEVFSASFGYNFCIFDVEADREDLLLSIMRSVRVDEEMEQNMLLGRARQLNDYSFISSEGGLRIQLEEGWNLVNIPGMQMPNTAFFLEKGDAQLLIQLFYTAPWPKDQAKDLLEAFLQMRAADPTGTVPSFGEAYAVTLEGLSGIEAWVSEEQNDVHILNLAFVHEGYGYYGSLMWIKPLDETARPLMEQALLTLAKPE